MPIIAKSRKGIIGQVLREFRAGKLNSGKKGPVVKNRKQAIAIALSEARRRGHRIPKKKDGRRG